MASSPRSSNEDDETTSEAATATAAAPSLTRIDVSLRNSPFCQQPASTPLRITCYGSSSSKTPAAYMKEARDLGYILAKRGHTCVNGAGSFGCMSALNEGAALGNGHIVGVIHEMWLVDNEDWESSSMTTNPLQVGKTLRDGGAHAVFTSISTTKNNSDNENDNNNENNNSGPLREMLVAGGDDLQERKKLLVQGADALVVLPGGPGTYDELWEMACVRKLGMANALPICIVNVDGFYDPFYTMLQRAQKDQLLDQAPEEIMKFVKTAQEAVEWMEAIQESENQKKQLPTTLQKRSTALRKSSFLGGSGAAMGNGILGTMSRSISYVSESLWGSFMSEENDINNSEDVRNMVVEEEVLLAPPQNSHLVVFASGVALGAVLYNLFSRRSSVMGTR